MHLEAAPDAQPLRRGRGRHQRALGNAAEDSPETHAFDTVKGSDYLGDQDAIEIFAREAPGDIYQLEHWGAVFLAERGGPARAAPVRRAGSPRTVFAADITGHVLIHVLYEQVMKRRNGQPEGVRGVLRLAARRLRRPLPGRDRLGSPARRAAPDHGQDDRDRHPAGSAARTA
jgi:hypothetical protein